MKKFLQKNYVLAFSIFVFFIYGHSKEVHAQNILRQAEVAEKEYNFNLALDLYRQAITKKENEFYALSSIARIYNNIQNYNQALEIYQSLASKFPDNPTTILGMAHTWIKKENLDQSYPLLGKVSKILNQYKTNPKIKNQKDVEIDLYLNYGLWHFHKENYEQASRYFQKAIEENPAFIEALTKLAHTYIIQKRFSQAKILLKRAYDINPKHSDVHQILAYYHLYLGQHKQKNSTNLNAINESYESALQSLLQARRINPQNTQILYEIVLLHIYKNDWENAYKFLLGFRSNVTNTSFSSSYFHYLSALIVFIQKEAEKNTPSDTWFEVAQNLLNLSNENQYDLERSTLEYFLQDHKKEITNQGNFRHSLSSIFLNLAKNFQKEYRHDYMYNSIYHALALDPSNKEAIPYRINFMNQKHDIEGILATYTQLLRFNPNQEKIKNTLEHYIHSRSSNLAYEEKLFNPTYGIETSNYKRASKKILVLPFSSEDPLPYFPNMDEILGRSISQEFEQPGPIMSSNDFQRNLFFKEIKKRQSYLLSQSALDSNLLQDYIKENGSMDYILQGSYKISLQKKLSIKWELRNFYTGTILIKKNHTFYPPFTLIQTCIKIRDEVLKSIPTQGEIIKIKNNYLIINLGSYDGLKIKKNVTVQTSTKNIELKISKLGAYLSKIELPQSIPASTFVLGSRVEFH